MKKALAIIISLLICTLCACAPGGSPPGTAATEQTQPPHGINRSFYHGGSNNGTRYGRTNYPTV